MSLSEVSLIDHMGTDLTVVNAARVSFGKKKTEFTDGDETIIIGLHLDTVQYSFISRLQYLLQDS
mgnify:CR=1 FL=1